MLGDDAKFGAPWRESDFTQRLLHATEGIVLLTDRDARIVLFNERMRDLCGHPLAELRGQDWIEVLTPASERPRLRELYAAMLDEARVEAQLIRILTKSGDTRQIEWSGTSVHDPDGGVLGIVSVGRDVSRHAETERLVNVGMVASVLAHEIGNPLNAIFLQAQLLRRRVDRADPGPLAPKLDSMLTQIRRLNALLEDFRAYQHPAEVALAPTDLGPILSRVESGLASRAAEAKVRVECELDALPQVTGNTTKLEQVFAILCKNGLEAMPGGGTLRLRARAEDDRVRVEVEDEGVGIAEGVDVFAPFFTTKCSGLGLGLALAHAIVAAHGGDIDFVRGPERGTTFVVTLPR